MEWKWGGPTQGERKTKARDSGILVHGVGEDGAYHNTWLESIESQIIEGGCGDFILVGGRNKPSLTAEVREGANNQVYWHEGGKRSLVTAADSTGTAATPTGRMRSASAASRTWKSPPVNGTGPKSSATATPSRTLSTGKS